MNYNGLWKGVAAATAAVALAMGGWILAGMLSLIAVIAGLVVAGYVANEAAAPQPILQATTTTVCNCSVAIGLGSVICGAFLGDLVLASLVAIGLTPVLALASLTGVILATVRRRHAHLG